MHVPSWVMSAASSYWAPAIVMRRGWSIAHRLTSTSLEPGHEIARETSPARMGGHSSAGISALSVLVLPQSGQSLPNVGVPFGQSIASWPWNAGVAGENGLRTGSSQGVSCVVVE